MSGVRSPSIEYVIIVRTFKILIQSSGVIFIYCHSIYFIIINPTILAITPPFFRPNLLFMSIILFIMIHYSINYLINPIIIPSTVCRYIINKH